MSRQVGILGVIVGVLVCSSAGWAGPQVLEVSPRYLEFTGYEGGANPAAQVLSIWNSGHANMDWTVTPDCNWLTIEPNSGTSSGDVDDANVIVDINGLAEGTYSCQLTVTGSGAPNSPQIVDVNLVVIGPIIELSATQFEFTAIEGGSNPANQILSISNIGGGTLNWEITEACGWLTAEPNSGSSTGEVDDVNLRVDITGLAAGSYDCDLTVTAPYAGNSPQIVDVNLVVAGPEIALSATQLEFTAIEGGSNPAEQILAISNSGGGTLNWEITEDCNWLTVEPNSGSSTGEVDDVNLSVDITGLAGGTYNCQLTVADANASNSPQNVDVNLVIHEPSLVSWWKFDEGAGSTAYDSAGGTDGTLVGDPCWTSGQIDGALEFDKSGGGDLVDCGNDVSISELSTFSISVWFKTDVVPGSGAHPHLIGQSEVSDFVWSFILHGDYSGRLTGRIETSGTAAVGRSNFIPATGQWYHAVMTYDDSGDRTVRVYVDGVEQAYSKQTAGTGTMSADPSIKVAIGNRIGGGKGWDGVIDDVRIYVGALSAGEILQLYRWGLSRKAYDPHPGDGATGVEPNVVLGWTPGPYAADVNGHDVYFGTDYNDVNDATTISAEYMGNQEANSWDVNNYDANGLGVERTYYWRIDEVNDPNIWKGNVWTFQTIGRVIELSATQLEFTGYQGGSNPATQILGISNSGAGTLNWTIGEDCNWLVVEPNSGRSTGEVDDVNVSVDITGLGGGTYNCQLTVSDSNATNSPQIVDVNLVVIGPVIEMSATELEFTAYEGASNPADQVLGINNSGGGTLNWEIAYDCNWLSVEPNSGSSTGEVDDVNVSVDITGLGGGTYNCQLTVSDSNATNSPQIVDVNLVVIGPVIDVSATQFDFTAYEGGANPNDQILSISNSGGETLNWTIIYDCNWLVAEPNSGSSTGEVDDVNLSVDITGLAGGDYYCELTISDPNAQNSPQTAQAHLAIYAEGTIYVPAEYPTIQAGIDAAVHGYTVIVVPNTYTGDGNRDLDFGGKAITVRSTDPEDANVVAATIIDCNGSSSEPHRGFSFHSGEGPNSVVAGFTITNGAVYDGNYGGGIYCSGASPTIQDCVITNNSSKRRFGWDGVPGHSYGGGIYCMASSPAIINCTISNNITRGWIGFGAFTAPDGENGYGGGISCTSGSNPTIINCTIGNNIADGGGGQNGGASALAGDGGSGYGGGVYCDSNSHATIEDCNIGSNIASGGNGGLWNYGAPGDGGGGYGAGIYCGADCAVSIVRCIVKNNQASAGRGGNSMYYTCGGGGNSRGGGIYNVSQTGITIEGCRISGNTVSGGKGGSGAWEAAGGPGGYGYGGGVYNHSDSNAAVFNCLIAGNTVSGGNGGRGNSEGFGYEGGDGGDAFGGGMYCGSGSDVMVGNCSSADNLLSFGVGGDGNWGHSPGSDGAEYGGGMYCSGTAEVIDSIIWGNDGNEIEGIASVTYSDIEGGYAGTGNIVDDPCFVDPCNGDYHLQSAAGRWDPNSESWVADANTSIAIDAGNPSSDWTEELWPHGGRINMGAYGGTPEASMSLSGFGDVADFNCDLLIDVTDLAMFVDMWLVQDVLLKEDTNRDGLVNFLDYEDIAHEWLEEARWPAGG